MNTHWQYTLDVCVNEMKTMIKIVSTHFNKNKTEKKKKRQNASTAMYLRGQFAWKTHTALICSTNKCKLLLMLCPMISTRVKLAYFVHFAVDSRQNSSSFLLFLFLNGTIYQPINNLKLYIVAKCWRIFFSNEFGISAFL